MMSASMALQEAANMGTLCTIPKEDGLHVTWDIVPDIESMMRDSGAQHWKQGKKHYWYNREEIDEATMLAHILRLKKESEEKQHE